MQEMSSYPIHQIREDFPILNRSVNNKPLVYLDSGASSQKPKVVIDAVLNCYETYYSNVHRGIHQLSQEATNAYEAVREIIQKHIHSKQDYEILFTRGTTESINLLAHSFGKKYLKQGDEIILSEMEHHANIVPWQMICEQYGAVLKVIPVLENGDLDMSAYEHLLTEKTKMVSVQHVSNVLGTVNPVKEIIEKAHRVGAYVHLDGAQAVPHFKINVQELNVDFYSFSGHKLFAPTGTGILYGKEQLLNEMPPFLGGGNMIHLVSFEKTTYNELPHKFETGTPNIAEFIGLGKAINYVNEVGMENIASYEDELTVYMNERLKEIEGLRVLGTSKHKVGVFSFVIEGLHSYDIGMLLNEYGIAVRTGHHCCQPLMKKFGVDTSVRASLAMYNTKEEIDFFIEKLLTVKRMLQ